MEKELKENDAERLFYDIEMPLVPVLVNIERNGVLLDTEALKQSSAHFTAQMEQIEKEIYELAGETFNIASPKQVGEVLFDKLKIVEKAKKTKTGQYVTSEEVLESLRHKHPVVEKILEHRGLKKLLGTYIDALPQLINPRTGRVHTSFNQTVTATGRLSSSNPNLQISLSATRMEKKSARLSSPMKAASSSLPTIRKSNCASWHTLARIRI